MPVIMNREENLSRIFQNPQQIFDIVIIGGGATGAGIAIDAVSRGFSTLLLEQADFAKGTSSRSTKLLHGGVRYLAQGDLLLVFEALKERGLILKNAPHITSNQKFIVPAYNWWEVLKYTIGLKFYDLLSGKLSLGKSKYIGKKETLRHLPGIKAEGLRGGIIYHDGRFDDSRLLISLIHSVHEYGGMAINYCKVTNLCKNDNRISGITAIDLVSKKEFQVKARVVVNATGVFSDEIIKMDDPVLKRTIRPSQGIHIVIDAHFLPGNTALMIPKTSDGRVLFAIPWYNKVVIGTTDTPVDQVSMEPKALEDEINFILSTAGSYFTHPPQRSDILTIFAGLRPLIANSDNLSNTRELSRRHKISISASGLVSVEGGKWTAYRLMAEEALNKIMKAGMIKTVPCKTHHLPVFGAMLSETSKNHLSLYGTSSKDIEKLMKENPEFSMPLHPHLNYTAAEIVWICRNEMPVNLEDVLARRTRALFLDAQASLQMAPAVASIMASEYHYDKDWEIRQLNEYKDLIKKYTLG